MVDNIYIQNIVNYFNKVATDSNNGFTVYRESFRDPYLSGAFAQIDPVIALQSSLIVEKMKQRRKLLVKVLNQASKAERKRNKKAFEVAQSEVDAISAILLEYL